MNLVDRYVYAVVSKLPEKQREDIEKEIRTLIEDMMEAYSPEEPDESKINKVLLELGDPDLLAEKYLDRKRYLIGPSNFNNYVNVLKIVLGAVFLGITIATGVGVILSLDLDFAKTIPRYIGSLFSASLQAFSWVTLGFAIAEYKGINTTEQLEDKGDWNPKDLPPVPQKGDKIPPMEPILGMIFSVVFLVLFYFTPQLIGVAHISRGEEPVVISMFNIETLRSFGFIILGIFSVSMLKEVLKLVYGKWTLQLSILYSILSVISLGLIIVLLYNAQVWNGSFLVELTENLNLNFISKEFDYLQIRNIAITIITIISGIDIVSALYKGLKYNARYQKTL
ncbi:hypothetical protein [Alkaliphilus transvaalensis]|uniref:hypothetical protein n=1 Tax=Alkaliphilus transvaalensis TaxID=114628 RepID=UPI0006886201|nr:hypothetical protein [Alkaliphilus transvaalensis]